mgnify:CR=1 FL=1
MRRDWPTLHILYNQMSCALYPRISIDAVFVCWCNSGRCTTVTTLFMVTIAMVHVGYVGAINADKVEQEYSWQDKMRENR